jgi:methylated-DNA-[protein]-cysteine S-methyltransferase
MPGALMWRDSTIPAVSATHVSYEARGWGVGEIWLDGDRLLHHELPRPGVEHRGKGDRLAERFVRYFSGEADDFFDVELELDGSTAFELELTATLRRIGRGETVTYGELAALAGRPNAQRAAGSFCARNRFSIVVPCHRVVAADGLGSYGSLGVEYKRRLLELEGVVV